MPQDLKKYSFSIAHPPLLAILICARKVTACLGRPPLARSFKLSNAIGLEKIFLQYSPYPPLGYTAILICARQVTARLGQPPLARSLKLSNATGLERTKYPFSTYPFSLSLIPYPSAR